MCLWAFVGICVALMLFKKNRLAIDVPINSRGVIAGMRCRLRIDDVCMLCLLASDGSALCDLQLCAQAVVTRHYCFTITALAIGLG